jgi:hypothetical protein
MPIDPDYTPFVIERYSDSQLSNDNHNVRYHVPIDSMMNTRQNEDDQIRDNLAGDEMFGDLREDHCRALKVWSSKRKENSQLRTNINKDQSFSLDWGDSIGPTLEIVNGV